MRRVSTFLLLATAILAPAAASAQSERPAGRSAQSASRAESANPVKRTWDFTKRFGIAAFAGDPHCADGGAAFAAFIADYNGRVDAFLAGPIDPKKLNLERKNYVRQVLGSERDIAAYLGSFEETGNRRTDSVVPPIEADFCRAQLQRASLIAIRESLKAMARIYPDMAEVAPRLAQVNAALARIGDDRAMRHHVSGNRAASLASVRLKPPLARNAAWEEGLRQGFERLVPGEAVLKLHLYSSDWYVHKNALTAVPEYRQIGAWVASQRNDGTCWITGIDLWQNFNAAGFDSGEVRLGQAPQQILCENF